MQNIEFVFELYSIDNNSYGLVIMYTYNIKFHEQWHVVRPQLFSIFCKIIKNMQFLYPSTIANGHRRVY